MGVYGFDLYGSDWLLFFLSCLEHQFYLDQFHVPLKTQYKYSSAADAALSPPKLVGHAL